MVRRKIILLVNIIFIIILSTFICFIETRETNINNAKVVNKWSFGRYGYILIENKNGTKEQIKVLSKDYNNIEENKIYNIKTKGFTGYRQERILYSYELKEENTND